MRGAAVLVALVASCGALAPGRRVQIYDTTLRDGTQGEGITCSVDDKLKIAARLASFGVDYVEAGWPGSNPKDAEFFARARDELDADARSRLVAFGSTRSRRSSSAEDDAQLAKLVEAGVGTACIVCKASAWQTTEILGATTADNLDLISSSVAFLVEKGVRVHVDMEHYYDGALGTAVHGSDGYGLECCRAAVDAGAECVVLCDTNGGRLPWEIDAATRAVVDAVGPGVAVGVHVHDDGGLAVGNSLAAVAAGAAVVQGTINGVGERTGNANLCTIIATLALKARRFPGGAVAPPACASNVGDLTGLSRFVDETLNRGADSAAAYVGSSAFAHKGGLHVSAVAKHSEAYEHVPPGAVGNEQRVLVSELSGRANILSALATSGLVVEDGCELEEAPEEACDAEGAPLSSARWRERAAAILKRVKSLENLGYSFEGAEASVHLMLLHASPGYCQPFSVLDYSVTCADVDLDSASRVAAKARAPGPRSSTDARPLPKPPTARATVKVRVAGGATRLDVAEGPGPVNALACALVASLADEFPSLLAVSLVDYKVRILDFESATKAAARVECSFRDGRTGATWTTVSVDRNIISASANAMVDGLEFGVIEHGDSCALCDVDDLGDAVDPAVESLLAARVAPKVASR